MKWLILAALGAVLVWMLTSRASKRRRGQRDDGASVGDSGSGDARRHDSDADGGDSGSGGDGGGGGGD